MKNTLQHCFDNPPLLSFPIELSYRSHARTWRTCTVICKEKPMSIGTRFVSHALKIGALELLPKGRELKSGRLSPYFFNSGLFNTAETLRKLATGYAERAISIIDEVGQPDVIYGPAYKGIPLVVATAVQFAALSEYWEDVGYTFNRKEEKDHGEGGILVGAPISGKRVMIVDDVMTTGTSSGEAVKLVKEAEGIPICCLIAFDRKERGTDESGLSATQAFTKNYGLPVFSIATLHDLISVLKTNPQIPKGAETLPKVLEYQKQYGVSL